MFAKILIANRGEIACRIAKTAHKMGIKTVAVYSDSDTDTPHTRVADEAIAIGPAPASQSYLNMERILDAARHSNADAIHPGYGFLSENPVFAQAVEDADIVFIGPSPQAISAMGDKIKSREYAQRAKVNIIPGTSVASVADARVAALDIGYPVMIKAAAGGGGKGMRMVLEESTLERNFASCVQEAESSFGDGRVLLERYITAPRHIEMQLLADKRGNIVHLFERECSIQRRNQKIIEEAPSPFVTEETRAQMSAQAIALAKAVDYHTAGTVEFVADDKRNFYFLEMNTRLQVEHPVSEMITGLDLVEWMIRVADGEVLPFSQQDISMKGWAMESRIYAEDPYRDFLPSPGRLVRFRPPAEELFPNGAFVRNDTGVEEGGRISPHYDPMIAKLCIWAPERTTAIGQMSEALDRFEIDGIAHNLPLLGALMENRRFSLGELTTHFLDEEYPDGFKASKPDGERTKLLAAVAFCMEYRERYRNGRGTPLKLHISMEEWLCKGDCRWDGEGGCFIVSLAQDPELRVRSDWCPGLRLFEGLVNDERVAVTVGREKEGYILSYRGVRIRAILRTPRAAELMALLPVRSSSDVENGGTYRHLLCPMPGVVVSLNVCEGQEVRVGDVLAVVEAMKMQNILHAENSGRVARLVCAPGQQLGVGDMMIEFE